MTVVVNGGSGPVAEGEQWTNTYEGALREANKWLARIREHGITDVSMDIRDPEERDGRWTFGFRHSVTGKVVELVTHGIDDMDAYMKGRIFDPRVYWNGSSSATPRLEDWAAPGFVPLCTFRPAPTAERPREARTS